MDASQLSKIEELNSHDENQWQTANRKNSIPGYLKYLRLEPNGQHIEEAKQKLAELNKEREREIDKEWEVALASNSYYKVFQFTEIYPDSKHAPEYATKLKEREHFKIKEDEIREEELKVLEESEDNGHFAAEKRGIKAGVAGGIAMILISLVWFFGGLAVNRIFFYPPVLFVVGVYALIKGIAEKNYIGGK